MEVLFHIFYRNFGRAEENRSLYRGFRYIEVDLIEVPLYHSQPHPITYY